MISTLGLQEHWDCPYGRHIGFLIQLMRAVIGLSYCPERRGKRKKTCKYAHIYICMYTYIYLFIHVRMLYTYTYIYTMYIYIHIFPPFGSNNLGRLPNIFVTEAKPPWHLQATLRASPAHRAAYGLPSLRAPAGGRPSRRGWTNYSELRRGHSEF